MVRADGSSLEVAAQSPHGKRPGVLLILRGPEGHQRGRGTSIHNPSELAGLEAACAALITMTNDTHSPETNLK